MGKLKDKVCVITGGSSGIGKQVCIDCDKEGAKVVCVDLDNGESFVKELKDAIYIKCDVSKDSEVKEMIEKAVKYYGRIDCAFNNAGIAGVVSKIHNYPDLEFDKLVAVNLKGVYLCLKYEIKQMLKQGGSVYSIVNTSSYAGLAGFRENAPYSAVKFGVIGLTKSTALEYARNGIRVNAVCPGFIPTPLMKQNIKTQQHLDILSSRVPIGRIGKTTEVSSAVIWLFSEDSSFSTGIHVSMDGGFSAM